MESCRENENQKREDTLEEMFFLWASELVHSFIRYPIIESTEQEKETNIFAINRLKYTSGV